MEAKYGLSPTAASSVLAELQREPIVANTHDGLQAARTRGRCGGRRRRKLTPQQATLAQQLYDTGEHTVQQIADIFGVPRTTVYGHLDQVIAPLLAGIRTPRQGRPPAAWTRIDRDHEALRVDMHSLFQDLVPGPRPHHRTGHRIAAA